MDREHMAENDIDPENVIRTDRNGCLVTVYFAKKRNVQKETIVLESLLDTFEKRIQAQINSSSF
ncbi:MAG: hypothetical protein IIT39_02255 [Clostridia bacterium]|nr:hypothetical protein [Clostridia bacterium]